MHRHAEFRDRRRGNTNFLFSFMHSLSKDISQDKIYSITGRRSFNIFLRNFDQFSNLKFTRNKIIFQFFQF